MMGDDDGIHWQEQLGIIPKEHWSYPPWIDVEKADQARQRMADQGVLYGDSLSYRHMCR